MARGNLDPILLEVLWNRLVSVVEEQARALMRTSFTSVVREAGDSRPASSTVAGAWPPRPSPAPPATSTRWRRAPTISSQRTRSRP